MAEKSIETVLSEFSIENTGRSIYHKVKGLGSLLKRGKSRLVEKCEIFLLEDKVIFRIKGSEIYINCNPSRTAKVEVYFTDLLEALENDRSSELTFKVQERNFIINERKLLCQAKLVEINDAEFMLEAGLSALNFREVKVQSPSLQKDVYTLKSNGEEIHMDTIQRDAEKVVLLLKKYMVDSHKVIHLIMENIR